MSKMRERLEKYKNENEEFIVLNSGLSRFRTLRVFLVNKENASGSLVYDIIVNKQRKSTTLSKRTETILKIKADLGALTEEEKKEISQEMESNVNIINCPYYYAEVLDLVVDLNFKYYMETNFNVALKENGESIEKFEELEETCSMIFIANVENEEDSLFAKKSIKHIINCLSDLNVFYSTFKHVMFKFSPPLHLENFTETKEFFEGYNRLIPFNSKIAPLKLRETPTITTQISPVKEIKFVKFLNKKPLRYASPSKADPLLPILPHRYAINKQQYKSSPMRQLFLDEYKHPIFENGPISSREKLDPETCSSKKTDCNYQIPLHCEREGKTIGRFKSPKFVSRNTFPFHVYYSRSPSNKKGSSQGILI